MLSRRIGLLGVALLLACGGKDFTGLQPKLEVRNGVKNPNTSHYLIDFGNVSVGVTGYKSLIIANVGRALMDVPPLKGLNQPFGQGLFQAAHVSVQAILQLSFTFTPTAEGPFTQTVTLETTGGKTVLDFVGNGVIGPPPDCVFSVAPMQFDFGNVLPGQSVTSGVHFSNTGATDCTIHDIQIDPSSNAAFTLAAGQPTQATVAMGDGAYPIGVTFAPTQTGDSFTGKLTLIVGPQETTVEVPLSASARPNDCTFTVSPTSVAFGNVMAGTTKTATVTFTQTGTAACQVSAVELDPSSNSAFHLGASQATSSNLISSGDTFAIQTTFTPAAAGNSFTGKLTFLVGPQNTPFEVPLSGSSTTATCTFHLTPSSLGFGAVVAGHSKTLTATVTRSGSTNCTISGVQMEPSSNAAFSLASGQATSGSLPNALSSFPIKVTFAPRAVGNSFTGKVSLQIGPPGSTVYVSLSGSSPAPCSNPNPDGTCPAATGSIYLNTSSDLYRFDPGTHQASHIGAFNGSAGVFNMYDIAIDTNGQMIGVSSGTLYVVDPVTALCTEVGSVDSSANGLTFLPDNRLVVSAGSTVSILAANTYAVQHNYSTSYTSSGDIIGLPDGMLYWTVQGGDDLIKVNPANGQTTRLGSLGQTAVYGLGYANGTLFGFNDGHYMVINQATGAATAGSVSGSWYGATTNPLVW